MIVTDNEGDKLPPSNNRNAPSYYVRIAGRCTRCTGPFRKNTAFIVDERVCWTVWGDTALTQMEKVPVCSDCSDCVTPREESRAVERADERECPGCGLTMKVAPMHGWAGSYCSSRCEQRGRRARKRRQRGQTYCTKCGNGFTGRTGAKFCSNACRQAAYRIKQMVPA